MTDSIPTELQEQIQAIQALPGRVSLYFENLKSGYRAQYNSTLPTVAASVIKIPVMVEFFYQVSEGKLDIKEFIEIHSFDKKPSCGALTYMHDGLKVTLLDLCTLMIILSDNTATNLLIRRLGMDNINRRMRLLGLVGTEVSRLLFDGEAQSRGLENHVTAADIARLLRLMYENRLPASDTMLQILKNQRLNGKMPFFLHGTSIAHKTGEDDGITHDVGIVYTPEPFIACFLSEETDVPRFERCIQDTALAMAKCCKL